MLRWMCGSHTQRQDQERIHPWNNEGDTAFQTDHGETIEESVENRYIREKKERTTGNNMERRMPMRHEKYWTESGRGDEQGNMEKEDQLRAGEETDRAMWRRKIS